MNKLILSLSTIFVSMSCFASSDVAAELANRYSYTVIKADFEALKTSTVCEKHVEQKGMYGQESLLLFCNGNLIAQVHFETPGHTEAAQTLMVGELIKAGFRKVDPNSSYSWEKDINAK